MSKSNSAVDYELCSECGGHGDTEHQKLFYQPKLDQWFHRSCYEGRLQDWVNEVQLSIDDYTNGYRNWKCIGNNFRR